MNGKQTLEKIFSHHQERNIEKDFYYSNKRNISKYIRV